LGQIAGEAIQQPATGVVFESIPHDRQDKGIAHQFTAGHHGFGFVAEGSSGLHLGPQQIAGGEMEEPLAGGKALGLGAFAGTGRAKEKKTLLHGGRRNNPPLASTGDRAG